MRITQEKRGIDPISKRMNTGSEGVKQKLLLKSDTSHWELRIQLVLIIIYLLEYAYLTQ